MEMVAKLPFESREPKAARECEAAGSLGNTAR